MTTADVLSGAALYAVEKADCLEWLSGLPADSVDLVMGSPNYEKQRDYGELKLHLRSGEAWVEWMVEVFRASQRVCRGLVVMVVQGFTRQFRWSATPALLMADLHRAGFHLWVPPLYKRDGICGSGGSARRDAPADQGPPMWKNRYEFCVCTHRPGRLPWVNACATGKPPKYGPGGEISHRKKDGSRVNDPRWGGATRKANGEMAAGSKDGARKRLGRGACKGTVGSPKGSVMYKIAPDGYKPPKIANPGNIIDCGPCGGGHLGDADAHESEAPYPEQLVEPFVRCFSPPGGVVADCFMGSSTTGAVALRWGRRYIGCDLRQSQVDLSLRRLLPVVFGSAVAPMPPLEAEPAPPSIEAADWGPLFEGLE